MVSTNSGGVAGGSGVQYFIGTFDGVKFTNDNAPATKLPLDYGKDLYAAVCSRAGKSVEKLTGVVFHATEAS